MVSILEADRIEVLAIGFMRTLPLTGRAPEVVAYEGPHCVGAASAPFRTAHPHLVHPNEVDNEVDCGTPAAVADHLHRETLARG